MPDQPINILLVEDNPVDSAFIRENLLRAKHASFSIAAVTRLDAGLARLARGGIDLVILDLNLPDSQGMDTFVKIHGQHPDVPILVLTSLEDNSLAARIVRQGAEDYLVKGQWDANLLVRSARYAIERHRAKMASQSAIERLRELNETKSQFVAEVSHEIRTPLAIIREFVALVRDEVVGPLTEKQRNCLESALRNCDKLAALINQILDLARIESGKTELRRIKVSLPDLLTQMRNDFDSVCRSKQQALTLAVPDNLPAAHCDVMSVQNIITNLLGNAHKFTPAGGAIRIRAGVEGQFLRIDIEDNGTGIPPQDQERIFEAFTQLDRQHGPGAKGTGLGLKIVKSLVELNGGVISVASEPGKGSCFSFLLPKFGGDLASRILIVDDEETVIRATASMLKHADLPLEIKTTTNGFEALLIAGEFKPHLVILDLHLVEVRGDQVLQSLKWQDKNYPCKVLIISGDPSLPAELKGVADDFLAKPFTADELLDKARYLLGMEPKQYSEPIGEAEDDVVA